MDKLKENDRILLKEDNRISLMKIIITDKYNLLQDKNQSIKDYEKEKKSYEKIIKWRK